MMMQSINVSADTTTDPPSGTTNSAIDRATTEPITALIIDHGAVDHVTGLDVVQTIAVDHVSGIAPSTCPNMAILIAVRAAVAVDHVTGSAFMNQCQSDRASQCRVTCPNQWQSKKVKVSLRHLHRDLSANH